jgi:hypothetical protein
LTLVSERLPKFTRRRCLVTDTTSINCFTCCFLLLLDNHNTQKIVKTESRMAPPAFNDHGANPANGHISEPANGHIPEHANGHATLDAAKAAPATKEASPADLAKLLLVEYGDAAAFTSRAVSLVALPRGSPVAPLVGLTGDTKSYATLQISRTQHVQLNSTLLYCNHSCTPSLEFDATAMEVRVARDRDLAVGDPLTFWYPSTEWEMAQPFACTCGTAECKGWISGARDMKADVLGQYWLNEHIKEMLAEREPESEKNGVEKGN